MSESDLGNQQEIIDLLRLQLTSGSGFSHGVVVWNLMLLTFVSYRISVSGVSTCKLCFGATEDVRHFLLVCHSLSAVRLDLIASSPDSILSLVPDISTDPDIFLDSVFGVDWIDDSITQLFFLRITKILPEARITLLVPLHFLEPLPLLH